MTFEEMKNRTIEDLIELKQQLEQANSFYRLSSIATGIKMAGCRLATEANGAIREMMK